MRLFIPTLIATALLATACVFSHAGPGLIYMNVEGPLGMSAAPGMKTGTACARNLFAIVAVGDATIESAKQDGGVSTVKEVSYKSSNILGVASFCTVVTGD